MTMVKKFDASKLSLENIIIKSASFENEDNILEFENGTTFKITASLQPGINIEQKKVLLVFRCSAEASKDNVSLKARCNFEIAYIFHVSNLEELVIENDVAEVDDDLASSVANIAYSSSRGIIFTRCQGTLFSKFIIPVVSTKDLITLIESKSEQIN